MINKWVGIGRITKDIELKNTQNQTSVVTCTLAVNRRIKSEGQPDCDYIKLVAWGKTAELMAQYLGKGSQLGVEGKIQTGSYKNKEGKNVYTTDIVVDNLQFLDGKNSSHTESNQGSVAYSPVDEAEGKTLDIDSDDLPF